jgi:hypothetical protein
MVLQQRGTAPLWTLSFSELSLPLQILTGLSARWWYGVVNERMSGGLYAVALLKQLRQTVSVTYVGTTYVIGLCLS